MLALLYFAAAPVTAAQLTLLLADVGNLGPDPRLDVAVPLTAATVTIVGLCLLRRRGAWLLLWGPVVLLTLALVQIVADIHREGWSPGAALAMVAVGGVVAPFVLNFLRQIGPFQAHTRAGHRAYNAIQDILARYPDHTVLSASSGVLISVVGPQAHITVPGEVFTSHNPSITDLVAVDTYTFAPPLDLAFRTRSYLPRALPSEYAAALATLDSTTTAFVPPPYSPLLSLFRLRLNASGRHPVSPRELVALMVTLESATPMEAINHADD